MVVIFSFVVAPKSVKPFERTAASLSQGVRADAAKSYPAAKDASRELAVVNSRKHERVDLAGKRRRCRQVYKECVARLWVSVLTSAIG